MKYTIAKITIISAALIIGNAALAQCSCCPPATTAASSHDHHAAENEHVYAGQSLTESEISTVLPAYLQIQEALAGDNLSGAKAAGAALSSAVSNLSRGARMQLWNASKSIAEAEEIATARKAFLTISDVLIASVESADMSMDSELYLAYCPMAYNNTGGSWLQDESTLANPYYGAMMLRCGTIEPIAE